MNSSKKFIQGNLLSHLSSEEIYSIFKLLNREALITTADQNQILTYENKNFLNLLKYSKEELKGKKTNILRSGYHTDKFYENFWEILYSNRAYCGDVKFKAKDGADYWLKILAGPLSGKNPDKYIAILFLLSDKKMMETLQLEYQYARNLLESSLDPLVTIDVDGLITDVNEASVNALGIPREKLIGTNCFDYFTDPKKAKEGVMQAFKTGAMHDFPLSIQHMDGRLVDSLWNASVYKDQQGNVKGIFASAKVINKFKQLMNEYIQTKNFLENILQSSTKYSIYGTDLNLNIIYWNEGAKTIYGYTSEEIIGKNARTLFSPDELEKGSLKKFIDEVLKKGLSEGEFNRVKKDGTIFITSLVVSIRKDPEGSPIGFLFMSYDITLKKLFQEKIIQSSIYFRSLIEASLDPLVTIDQEGKITDVNQASVKATGIPKEKLIGTDFSDYFTDPKKAREGYQEVLLKGSVQNYPLTIRHANGQLMDVLYNASIYKDHKGNILGIFAAARNVTAQKKAERELANRLEELEKFYKLTQGREIRMNELENEILELKKERDRLKSIELGPEL